MRIPVFVLCSALTSIITGCYHHKSPDEVPNYRLTPAQLEWQIYRKNDELRFGNARSAKVRRYRITHVIDTLQEERVVGPLGGGTRYYYQRVAVKFQRADSIVFSKICLGSRCDSSQTTDYALDLQIHEGQPDKTPYLSSYSSWPGFSGYYLPVDLPVSEWNSSASWQYLPQATLGGRIFTDVLRYTTRAVVTSTARFKFVRTLYVTKQQGVVGFEEDGSGLWYRLP
ncbi:hypothetical protein [Hymenobacter sp. BT190]|uniref:hypothetical protein n=1 Tax=Hymenobacter sp. BT190 TaxID=2763505 RepID=UPI0016511AE1|nr:hypothetical protein [Hymenobacter sp. BT190]